MIKTTWQKLMIPEETAELMIGTPALDGPSYYSFFTPTSLPTFEEVEQHHPDCAVVCCLDEQGDRVCTDQVLWVDLVFTDVDLGLFLILSETFDPRPPGVETLDDGTELGDALVKGDCLLVPVLGTEKSLFVTVRLG